MTTPVLGPTTRVVPGVAAADGVVVQRANNNLDAIDHDGRRFLVWRTAPIHFASPKTMLYVVSSADGGATWTLEETISLGRDVREPRFLSWDGRLFLFFTTLGKVWYRFEPDLVHCTERVVGDWTSPKPILPLGYLAWRPRVLGGRPVLSLYGGGGAIYTTDADPTGVELWTTSDGSKWAPIDEDRRIQHVGGSETEVIDAPSGGFVAITRKEGPHGGWGSDVCRVPDDLVGKWELRPTPRKFDSPLLFRHRNDIYLIARRQLAAHGRFDRGWSRYDIQRRTKLYQGLYWISRKRTALWKVDPETLDVEWLLDLPSRGDTCFPAIVRDDADRFTIYNYSSPVEGRDRIWVSGQFGPTWIYATGLAFES